MYNILLRLKFFIIFILIANIVFADTLGKEEIENKVDTLLSKMTLQEKIGQMQQISFWGSVEDLRETIKNGKVGSFLNASDAKSTYELQKIAVEETRLGIPLIFARDVIHGQETIFPIPLGQAASWNAELIEKAARVAAVEATATGIKWTFAPMIDISRDPRWGRVAESCGEDPYLTSKLGAAMIKGFQGKDLTDPTSMAACAKHFVGYGASEAGKDYNTTFIPERQLREIHLKPFKEAVDVDVASMMSAFNDINGIPASGNKFTLKTILRDEWGFNGLVVSDWASMTQMIMHGFCEDEKEVAFKSIEANIDMEMASTSYIDHLETLINEKKIDAALIDNAVKNILRLKYKLGLFENPYTAIPDSKVARQEEHLKVAEKLAGQSIVLLKNKNEILPLSDDFKKIAVIGPLADNALEQNGCWVFEGFGKDGITPLTALKEKFGNDKEVIFAKGLKSTVDSDEDGFADAISAANKSDVVLLFIGEDAFLSGESHCRAFLNLPGAQEELVSKLAATGKPIITIIMAGRPLTFEKIESEVDAILYAWHPGTMGGPAIADILTGVETPSGKLPITFPRSVGQIPIYYAHHNTGRPAESVDRSVPLGTPLNPKGFASFYLDVDISPAYPFGYGLSYTKFDYSAIKIFKEKYKLGEIIEVECLLKNLGNYNADEIVQLYIRDLSASAVQPVKLLKGFQRIHLKTDETKTVKFSIHTDELSIHDAEMESVTEPGKFKIWIGSNSADLLESEFEIIK
ncbi:MAG: beta-glucosidase BglX [Melioribacteraceae bacterium]|nr:beta-glucosidase BglX [Melioribacteraceae bacterium]